MKWSKSTQNLTRDEWFGLNHIERYDATRFWVQQNRNAGRMTKRAAYTSMRKALQRAQVIIPPITSLSKLQLLSFEYKSDFLIEKFFPDRKRLWRVGGRRRPLKDKEHYSVISVREFSLLDNPRHVFTTLQNLCFMEAVSPPGQIDFIDDRIRDIGAYLLFSILYQRMVRFADGGRISPRVAKVLKAVGVTEAMRIDVRDHTMEDVFPLPLATQTRQNMVSQTIGEETSKKEKVAGDVIEKVGEWLMSVGVVLPKSALAPLGEAVGEVLNNAERHSISDEASDDSGGWWLAGFMARRKNEDGTHRHVCHISVVGLGLTISDTLMRSPRTNKRFYPQFDDYSKLGGKKLTAEQMAMVLSLQDGVTSKADQSGGLGMQDLISNIFNLGEGMGRQKMCIALVSGSTCIRVFNGHLKQANNNSGHRQCWLNDLNSPNVSPDEKALIDIGMDFPGTCISLRFELDPEHLIDNENGLVRHYPVGHPIHSAKYRDI